jgi:isocitrate/isopropylmalate dehydrogenase
MKLLVLPGDGIGPEIMDATLAVLRSIDARLRLGLEFEFAEIGFAALAKFGTTLPEDTLERARGADGVLLGPISHLDYPPRDRGGVNVSAAFRVKLDLFANIRPARTWRGVPHRGTEMDLVIVRECTEGFYPDRNMVAGSGEFMPTEDVALSVRKITARACRRIAEVAFALAAKRRGKVTAVHKANNFILTDGLFLSEVREVARGFPEVELEEVIVDAMAALLVRDASRFDVIVSTNFYCDILSDLASELSGSLGLAGSINAGESLVAAQAQHGSAPDIAGQDKANPTSLVLSAAMMLDWLGERRGLEPARAAARAIARALERVLSHETSRTADLGGPLGTRAFAAELCRALDQNA